MRDFAKRDSDKAKEVLTVDREAAMGMVCSSAAWSTAANMVEREILGEERSE